MVLYYVWGYSGFRSLGVSGVGVWGSGSMVGQTAKNMEWRLGLNVNC